MDEPQNLGLLARLRRLASSSLGMVSCRIALFATELEEDILRLGAGVVHLVLAAIFFAFFVLVLLAFLTVLFWDDHRLLALGISTLIFLGLALWSVFLAARRLRPGHPILAQTRIEFSRDLDAVTRNEP